MKPKSAYTYLPAVAVFLLCTFATVHLAFAQDPGMPGGQTASSQSDSAHLNQLFASAKTEAAMLQRDSEELVTFQRQAISWQTHAQQLESMRAHVNQIGQLEQQMRDARQSGSAWQQEAVDRVNPLLKELADNLGNTITHANQHVNQLRLPAFRDLVDSNAALATDLNQMIAASVDYGQRKLAFEAAQDRFIQQGDR